MNRYQQAQASRAGAPLASSVTRTGMPGAMAGPISVAAPEVGEGTFSVTLDNSGGSTKKKFVIGDGNGVWASASGETVANPSSGSISGAALNASFRSAPCKISEINYITSSDKAQFSESFRYVIGSRNGNANPQKINVARFISAADQNTLVRTLKFAPQDQPILSGHSGLVIEVLAGEKVNLELTQAEVRL